MAEEFVTVELQENFYRDGIKKLFIIFIGIFLSISLVIGSLFYIYLNKPLPVTFLLNPEWRIQPEISINQPYLSITDLLQWVSNTMPKVFTYDFISYNEQLKHAQYYFTPGGWKVFSNYLKSYADYTNVQKYRQFINAVPKGVPILLNQGLLSGRYAWWVQIPIQINYLGFTPASSRALTFQILVVRVSTLNNLSGVGIENIILANPR